MIPDLVVHKKKMQTPQSQRDHVKAKEYIDKFSAKFNDVQHELGKLFRKDKPVHKQLLQYTMELSVNNNFKVTRLMKRNKNFLIAWYCEHYEYIELVRQVISGKSPPNCITEITEHGNVDANDLGVDFGSFVIED